MLDQKGFDLWANEYDAETRSSEESDSYPFAGYSRVLRYIYDLVTERSSPKVLDIGFGTAVLTAKLYDCGCRIWGQDFSQRMIEIAQQKMPQAKLCQGDFGKGIAEPLLKQNYDFIIATYALHHLTDDGKIVLINSLGGLLKDGGAILIGDVAFRTREELEYCQQQAGNGWDDDEHYFVYEELARELPGLRFEKISHCSGVLSLQKEVNMEGLERFIKAQDRDYQQALIEIKAGRKRSHWIWYIFPQMVGLGMSYNSEYYGIKSRAEAIEYLKHPVLGTRLVEISKALLQLDSSDPRAVMGSPDDMKLKSSMTLFAMVSDDPVFSQVLQKYFNGERDRITEKMLGC